MNHIFERLFRHSPHFIFIKNASTYDFVDANNTFCEIFNVSRDQLIIDSVSNECLDSLNQVIQMIIQHLIQKREMVEIESTVQTPKGIRHWLIRAFLIMKSESSEISSFAFIAQDITERVNNTRLIKEKEQLWSFALDASGHGVWDWKINSGDVSFSKNWRSMLGYEDYEISNTFSDFTERLHPEDKDNVLGTLHQYLNSEISAYEVEFRMACKNGSWMWIESKGIVTERDEKNNPIRMVGTHIDINQKKRAEIGDAWRNYVLQLLLSNSDLNEILFEVVRGVEKEATGSVCSIMLLDDKKMVLKNAVAPNLPEFYKAKIDNLVVGPDVGCCGAAVFNNKIIIAENLLTHPNWKKFKGLIQQVGLKSCWSSPIKNSSGIVLGSLAIYHKSQSKPSKHDLKLLEQSAQFTGLAIERKRASETISHQANYDALTNLPNRRMFMDYLSLEMRKNNRKSKSIVLMFLDLDHFKEVNDTLGHHIGDELLREVSKRITKTVRDTDFIARLGGDEFTIVISDVESLNQIKTTADKVVHALAEPFYIQNELIYISGSVGITVYPEDASSLNMLLVNADQAMYEAKKMGRNCYQFFSQSMHEESIHKQKLGKLLRQALANNEFKLFYQPIIDMHTGKMCKAEALIRWLPPSNGIILPNEFISLSEEIGIIHEIGNWVFEEAFRWKSKCKQLYEENFKVTINMSPAQFKHPSKQNEYAKLLSKYNLSGEEVIIEITEGLILDNDVQVHKQLQEFHNHGIQIAIDDFGTGYSALSYLKRFDIDYLKIDRSFVKDIPEDKNDLALCMAIIVMAKKLGLGVVAEGIETEEQKELLSFSECNFGQGFLFSEPLEPQAFEKKYLKRKCRK